MIWKNILGVIKQQIMVEGRKVERSFGKTMQSRVLTAKNNRTKFIGGTEEEQPIN